VVPEFSDIPTGLPYVPYHTFRPDLIVRCFLRTVTVAMLAAVESLLSVVAAMQNYDRVSTETD